ncbi:methylated-DNA--[protein]-cysteine S-methyltransferase [Streptomyces sp. SID14478]|uniref:methylated-DNA--[protein]-cysteine S-methyltransferase n=1 Tax=Streptomyces sp. SID14478 TaxID=2706073 RepID=UPI0013DF9155|nr:methylated-DNA--[protein]-cysteine S-methyltransferase [Streptomyces sp. SID14478]NEB80125.1 methylated-DNA--[protein]-cysteine S-methyltransferase [Streptomyces sp. SID14478]
MKTHSPTLGASPQQTHLLYATLPGPLGDMTVVGEESAQAPGGTALVSLSLPGQRGRTGVPEDARHAPEAFTALAGQLAEYFAGRRTDVDLAFAVRGSAFERRVWSALEEIPYGTTTTYGALAARIGVPRGQVRELGAAIGRNPLLIVRPCHRVIGADGTLKGYAAGVPAKETLLVLEGALPAQLPLA